MSSTSQRDALAADLLADLATPPVAAQPAVAAEPTPPAAPRRPRNARPTPDAAPAPGADAESDADDPRTRGPGLETVLRVAPFDWYRPQLRIELLWVSVHVGPVYAKLGVRR